MSNGKTMKALEELAKSEYTTATALDAALAEAEDSKLRRNYRKWRDFHVKQAEALNGRIKELGGHTTRHEFMDGNVYPVLWGLIRGSHDYKSLAGVRLVAGRGIKHYIDHLDEIEDPKTLSLVRKNLEAKQGEMQWYDDQVVVEHNHELEAELEKTRKMAKSLEKGAKGEKKESRRGSPLAAIAVAGAIGAAAYLIARRNDERDQDDFETDQNGFADQPSYDNGQSAGHTENSAEV